jgi:hypothetical protein
MVMTSRGALPPSGRAITTHGVAGFKLEWPRSNRNRWPTSFRNQWPTCSGISTQRIVIAGNPNKALISTSLNERQNLTMRMSMRRFTRLTNAFSKKVENLRAAVSLHFAHYNFVRMHRTLRVTPAMEAGVSSGLWSLNEFVERTSN